MASAHLQCNQIFKYKLRLIDLFLCENQLARGLWNETNLTGRRGFGCFRTDKCAASKHSQTSCIPEWTNSLCVLFIQRIHRQLLSREHGILIPCDFMISWTFLLFVSCWYTSGRWRSHVALTTSSPPMYIFQTCAAAMSKNNTPDRPKPKSEFFETWVLRTHHTSKLLSEALPTCLLWK